jgi:hypothetical protein
MLLFEGKKKDKVLNCIRDKARKLGLTCRVGVLVLEEDCSYFGGQKVILRNLGPFNNLELMAKNLFSGIRSLDSLGADYILATAPPRWHIGLAIFDPLFKAAGSQTIVVD